jgi:hypothetical protein
VICDDLAVSITAEDLCAFLLDLDAPDRLERPLLMDPGAVEAGVARLSEALGAAFGHRCAVERLPEHYGSITVPGEATSAGAPIVLMIGWYGLTVAFAPNHRDPDGSATVLLDDDDFYRTEKALFATGFAYTLDVSGLTPSRPARPYPRLLSAGADEWLTSLDVLTPDQVLAEVERIRHCAAAMATPQGSDERRWLVIDDTILDGHTVWAIKAYRNEFGGGLQEAVLAVRERGDILSRTRPHGYAASRGQDAA